MDRLRSDRRIIALTYADAQLAGHVMRRLVTKLVASGVSCAGFLEHDEPPQPGRARCDMFIENLATGARVKISEDRGPLARGCHLDASMLATAIEAAREALEESPDALVINKFGKTEAEGAGFRSLIADAVGLGVSVLIAVPWRNIESWRLFAGDLAIEVAVDSLGPEDDASAVAAIGLRIAAVNRSSGEYRLSGAT
ncbi:MAG: DUF2478 domain-containing protein [Hyphomicrobiaceae bacterium]